MIPAYTTNSGIQFVQGLGPVAWFRYGVGITSALGAVSQWSDSSPNGNHLVQATGTNQPALQADNSILFDGADNFMKCAAFTLDQPATIYLLFKQVTWTLNDFVFGGEGTSNARVFQSATTPRLRYNAGTAGTENPDLATDTWAVLSTVFNGGSSLIQVNNNTAVASNSGTNAVAGFTLGSNADGSAGWSNIQVKEGILYSGAHSAATRTRVISYLMAVGGL